MAFGIIGTEFVDLQNGITDTNLRSLKTGSGLELADIVQEVDNAVRQINEGVNPVVASLLSTTTQDEVGSHRTSRKVVQRAGEWTVARPQRGGSEAHALGYYKHEIAIGFTEDGLSDMSMEDIRAELGEIVEAFQRVYVVETFERLFSPELFPISDKNSTITSPGFIGSGTYTGISPDGSDYPAGYSHYAVTDAAALETALDAQLAKLVKHHPTAFYDMIGSPGAIAKVKALGGTAFVGAGSALIRPGMGQAEATVDANVYTGVALDRIRVRPGVEGLFTADADTDWFAVYATYGSMAARNPLVYKYSARRGRRAIARDRALFPLTNCSVIQWFGINVADRAGAVLTMIDETATDYAAPEFMP